MTPVEIKPSPVGVPGAVSDTTGLHGEDLTFTGAEGTQVNGYLARPADTASDAGGEHGGETPKRPAMIVIHEAGGLNEHIRDVTNRFANLGYVALGVDLYTREGGPPPTDDLPAMMKRLFAISDERVLADLDGAATYLRSRDDTTGKLGCIGFCMGGRYTLLFATAREQLDAAVDCWGGFIHRATSDETSTATRPTPPLELAEQLHCPLLAAVGAEDQNPSPALGTQLRERAERSGQAVEVDVYEDAGHAFFADYRPNYRPAAAAELWERVVPFLQQHLNSEV
jgi:carboxymethylenebutenolidase